MPARVGAGVTEVGIEPLLACVALENAEVFCSLERPCNLDRVCEDERGVYGPCGGARNAWNGRVEDREGPGRVAGAVGCKMAVMLVSGGVA